MVRKHHHAQSKGASFSSSLPSPSSVGPDTVSSSPTGRPRLGRLRSGNGKWDTQRLPGLPGQISPINPLPAHGESLRPTPFWTVDLGGPQSAHLEVHVVWTIGARQPLPSRPRAGGSDARQRLHY